MAGVASKPVRDRGAPLLRSAQGPTHMHLLINLRPTQRLCDVVDAIKGALSREWNRQLRDLPVLYWQDGYWAESVTPSDLEPLQVYVRTQRQHHAEHHEPEPWERHVRVDASCSRK